MMAGYPCCCTPPTLPPQACNRCDGGNGPGAYQLTLPAFKFWRPSTGVIYWELPAGTYLCEDFELNGLTQFNDPIVQQCCWLGPQAEVNACVSSLPLEVYPAVVAVLALGSVYELRAGWFGKATGSVAINPHVLLDSSSGSPVDCVQSISVSFAGSSDPATQACPTGCSATSDCQNVYDAGTIAIVPL